MKIQEIVDGTMIGNREVIYLIQTNHHNYYLQPLNKIICI